MGKDDPPTKTSWRVLLSYVVTGLLCIPLWWYTCRITNKALPELSQSPTTWPLTFDVVFLTTGMEFHTNEPQKEYLKGAANELLSNSGFPDNSLVIKYHKKKTSYSGFDSCKTPQELDSLLAREASNLSSISGQKMFYIIPASELVSWEGENDVWYMGKYRHGWFVQKNQGISALSSLPEMLEEVMFRKLESNDRLATENDVTLSFSLLNADPKKSVFHWNFDEAYQRFLLRFLQKVEVILSTSVDSHVLHYGQISASPIQQDKTTREYFLTKEDVRSFVGTTLWNSVSTRSSSPAVEFLVYIPPESKKPLSIRQNKGDPHTAVTSFVVPRWGGVVVWNPTHTNPPKQQSHHYDPRLMSVDDLEPVMEIFVDQMRNMIGISNPKHHNFIALPSPTDGLTDWELDLIVENRILQNVNHVESSLNSLLELTQTVTHIPVQTHIHELVGNAIQKYNESQFECNSHKLENCLRSSRLASKHAHDAFFDPSMIPLLYFANDFTYAVYAPFFLPGFVPIFAALTQEWKRRRRVKKKAKNSE